MPRQSSIGLSSHTEEVTSDQKSPPKGRPSLQGDKGAYRQTQGQPSSQLNACWRRRQGRPVAVECPPFPVCVAHPAYYPKFMDAWARPGWDGDVSEPPYDDYDMQRADRNEACVIQDEVEERQQQEEDGREAGDSVVRIELEAVSAPAPAIPLPGPAPAPVGSLGLPSGPSRSMDEAGPRTGPEVSQIQGSPPLCPFERPGAAGSARPESHRAALRRSRVFQPGCTKIPLLVGGVTVSLLISHHQYPVRDAAVALAGSSPRRRGLVLPTPDHITREMLTQYKATTMRLVELDMEHRLCDVDVVKCHVLGDAETAESRTHRGRQIGAAAHDVRARLVYLDRELGKRSYTSGSQGLGLVAALSLVPLGLASEGLMWSGARASILQCPAVLICILVFFPSSIPSLGRPSALVRFPCQTRPKLVPFHPDFSCLSEPPSSVAARAHNLKAGAIGTAEEAGRPRPALRDARGPRLGDGGLVWRVAWVEAQVIRNVARRVPAYISTDARAVQVQDDQSGKYYKRHDLKGCYPGRTALTTRGEKAMLDVVLGYAFYRCCRRCCWTVLRCYVTRGYAVGSRVRDKNEGNVTATWWKRRVDWTKES
ncbi:hypothetical protein LZ32DRAFT_651228 [Colletotrichum eremochloae]|nr:hypothetical protein LZ32DRAFT_651228 [Colletotrichum eremochloae]